jgi:cell division protein FtsB
MKWLAVALAFVIVVLQFHLWLAPDGIREYHRLQAALTRQLRANTEMHERNQELAAEVADLKDGMSAIEERARTDLGMIAANETFYQVVSPAVPVVSARGEHRTVAAR